MGRWYYRTSQRLFRVWLLFSAVLIGVIIPLFVLGAEPLPEPRTIPPASPAGGQSQPILNGPSPDGSVLVIPGRRQSETDGSSASATGTVMVPQGRGRIPAPATDVAQPTATRRPTITPTATSVVSATPSSDSIWRPSLTTSWQIDFAMSVDQSIAVQVYDVDLFDNSAAVVNALHARGYRVMCYFSAGSYEDWRPDANQFPASVLGRSNGWPGEKWLDIRNLSALAPIMRARLDLCKQKGFDGADPDNVDGYTNRTGFPLTAQDQLTFNTWIANEAHARGLSVGLKNDGDQAASLTAIFDWALVEQCFEYNECALYQPFVTRGKPVFEIEYNLDPIAFCTQANAMNFNALYKHLSLDAYRIACR